MTIDGYVIEPLANGAAYVIADGVKTVHSDEASALRHVQRMSGERAAYEARRVVEGGKR
jgi:hypothetical protein